MARSLLLVSATVLLTLAVFHLLVRADLVSASLWSYYPIVLALSLAGLFGFRALRRSSTAGAASGGEK